MKRTVTLRLPSGSCPKTNKHTKQDVLLEPIWPSPQPYEPPIYPPYTQSCQLGFGARTAGCDAMNIVNNQSLSTRHADFMVSPNALYKCICNFPMAMPPELVCIALSAACCFARNSDSSWTKPGNCCDGSQQAALQCMRQQSNAHINTQQYVHDTKTNMRPPIRNNH